MKANDWLAATLFGVCTALGAQAANADTIYCWDGQIVDGKIVAVRHDRLVVALARGEVTISRAEIDRIVLDPGALRWSLASADAPAAAYLEATARDAKTDLAPRLSAVSALEAAEGPAAIVALASLVDVAEPAVRKAARDAFLTKARAPLPDEARMVLERYSQSEIRELRFEAALCLGVGDPACEEALLAMCHDEDESAAKAARESLARHREVVAREKASKATEVTKKD